MFLPGRLTANPSNDLKVASFNGNSRQEEMLLINFTASLLLFLFHPFKSFFQRPGMLSRFKVFIQFF